MNDPRYASGTSLTRTDKEETLDDIDTMLDLTDEEYLALKKLNMSHLRAIKKKMRAYGDLRSEQGKAETAPKKAKDR